MMKHILATLFFLMLSAMAVPHHIEERQVQVCSPISTKTVFRTVYLPSSEYQSTVSATTKTATATRKPISSSKTTSTSVCAEESTSAKSTSAKSTSTKSTSTTSTSATKSTSRTSTPTTVPPSTKGQRNVLYFTNWGIYGAKFDPQSIPADQVTHVLYSFADIAPDGTVKSSDTYADVEKHYPSDSWNDSGKNAYGCIKQLFLLKKKHRALKTLLSIGGWTYSPKFAPVAATDAGRKKFASTAVQLMADWGFDGLDIDWEYPTDATQARDFVLLLKTVRKELDKFSRDNKLDYRFLITVATPAGPDNYQRMDLKGMDPYIDAWHLMAYDYSGSWSTVTGHQANLYPSRKDPETTPFNTRQAVEAYLSAGIDASKVVLGVPLYGRSFAGTDGIGKPFTGIGGGSIEQGVWTYKDLPRPGATVHFEETIGAVWSYSASSKELVSYDNVQSAKSKAEYLLEQKLGGAVYWEASGDKTGSDSIVRTVAKAMGGLEKSKNLLKYPTSQYENIKAGMPS